MHTSAGAAAGLVLLRQSHQLTARRGTFGTRDHAPTVTGGRMPHGHTLPEYLPKQKAHQDEDA